MFGSVALDVAIGLIFIYLLYSLLASIISEMVAVFLGLRARNLAQAICRMLEDEKEDEEKGGGNKFLYFIRDIWHSLQIMLTNKRGGKTFKEFYDHPAIKYMARGKFFSKPSYFSADTFSKVVLDMLKSSGNSGGNQEIEKVKKALEEGNAVADSDKLKAIDRLLKETDQNTALDSIKIIMNRQGSQHVFNGDTRRFITSLLEDAQQDLEKFRFLLEKWFNETMERTTGWYKRIIQFIILVIGFWLAVTFNASTISIVQILSKDKDAREKLVQLASAYVENNPPPQSTRDNINKILGDSTTSVDTTGFQAIKDKLDSLQVIKDQLETDIEETSSILGLGWNVPDSLELVQRKTKLLKPEAQSLIFIQQLDNGFLYAKAPTDMNVQKASECFTYQKDSKTNKEVEPKMFAGINKQNTKIYLNGFKYRWKYFFLNFWGYLITALAISLGAPFWFDLLNKLVQLRSSVQAQSPSKTNDKN